MSAKPARPNPFTQTEGHIHIGGIDALVRLSLDQVRTDARRGLKTGMFISGYRGSPLGMLDAALQKQEKTLLDNNVHFVDGLNEDLGATAHLVPLRDDPALAAALDAPRVERFVGVVYRPRTERASHYQRYCLPRQFDAIVHLARTHALTPLDVAAPAPDDLVPETFPSGV